MWCLTFSADASSVDDAPDGTFSLGQQRAFRSSVNRPWVVTLKLGEHSSPTQVYAWLVVKRKSPVPTESEQSSSSIFIPLESQMRKLRPRRRHIGAILDKSVTGTDLPDGCVH
jgi:hypothetical protein